MTRTWVGCAVKNFRPRLIACRGDVMKKGSAWLNLESSVQIFIHRFAIVEKKKIIVVIIVCYG